MKFTNVYGSATLTEEQRKELSSVANEVDKEGREKRMLERNAKLLWLDNAVTREFIEYLLSEELSLCKLAQEIAGSKDSDADWCEKLLVKAQIYRKVREKAEKL